MEVDKMVISCLVAMCAADLLGCPGRWCQLSVLNAEDLLDQDMV